MSRHRARYWPHGESTLSWSNGAVWSGSMAHLWLPKEKKIATRSLARRNRLGRRRILWLVGTLPSLLFCDWRTQSSGGKGQSACCRHVVIARLMPDETATTTEAQTDRLIGVVNGKGCAQIFTPNKRKELERTGRLVVYLRQRRAKKLCTPFRFRFAHGEVFLSAVLGQSGRWPSVGWVLSST